MTDLGETTPRFPDPKQWHSRLADSIEQRQAKYDMETSPSRRRKLAAQMVGDVVLALRDLPRFRDVRSLLGLKDLLIFLADLEAGKNHPWLQSDGIGGGNSLNTAESELRGWVKCVSVLLIEHGFTKTQAYLHIAVGLTRSGRTASDGSSLDHKTIGKWARAVTPAGAEWREGHTLAKIRKWWEDNRNDPAIEAVSDKDIAGWLSDHIWSEDYLRDKSNSS